MLVTLFYLFCVDLPAHSSESCHQTKDLVAMADIIVTGTISTNKEWDAEDGSFNFPIRVLEIDQVLYGDPGLKSVAIQFGAVISGVKIKEGQSGLWFLSRFNGVHKAKCIPDGNSAPDASKDASHAYTVSSSQCFLNIKDLKGERSMNKIIAEITKRLDSDIALLKSKLQNSEKNLTELKADPKIGTENEK